MLSILSGRAPRAELYLLLTLALIQFTHVVDFMIVMPLGPRFKEVFHINSSQFGLMVAAYQFSAGVASLLGGYIADRFDRKSFLLVLYTGFIASTVGCALAPGYGVLVGCRILAGACGGLLSSSVLAIIGDEVPGERRGYAMGIVMGSFSVASAVGLPLGLLVASDPLHLPSFGLIATIMIGSFMIIPYIADSYVANAGISKEDLAYVYLVGGICTFFSMPLAGRLADRLGEARVFWVASVLTVLPMLVVTHLGPTPLLHAMVLTAFFMVVSSARMVPVMSLITQSVQPHKRGRFMSANIAVRELVNALAVFIGGTIIAQGADGHLYHFELVGYVGAASALLAIPIVYRIRKV